MSNRIRLRPAAPRALTKPPQGTYWNGQPATAVRVRLLLPPAEQTPHPQWWAAHLAGEFRDAVRVEYGDQVFYLDNADGSGWAKVTEGRGRPGWPHRSLYGVEVP